VAAHCGIPRDVDGGYKYGGLAPGVWGKDSSKINLQYEV
jgi:hypothetical protein